MIRVLLTAVLVIIAAGDAAAQGMDGSFFLRTCGAAVRQADGLSVSDEDAVGAIYCAGYVSGFLDANTLAANADGKKVVCLPERGVTNDQAVRIFVKCLRENPSYLHESGRMSLLIALAKTFPCSK